MVTLLSQVVFKGIFFTLATCQVSFAPNALAQSCRDGVAIPRTRHTTPCLKNYFLGLIFDQIYSWYFVPIKAPFACFRLRKSSIWLQLNSKKFPTNEKNWRKKLRLFSANCVFSGLQTKTIPSGKSLKRPIVEKDRLFRGCKLFLVGPWFTLSKS